MDSNLNTTLNYTGTTLDNLTSYLTGSTVLTTKILQKETSVSSFQGNTTYPVTHFPTTGNITYTVTHFPTTGNTTYPVTHFPTTGNTTYPTHFPTSGNTTYPVTHFPTTVTYDFANSSDYGNNSDNGDIYDYGNRSDYPDYYGGYDYGDEYMYPGFSFERPVYLVLWEFLVIFTSLVNVIVIYVLLQRKMRNSTNIILAAIAISDSLTGLVTLPSYIMVFQRFDPFKPHHHDGSFPLNQSGLPYGDYLTHPHQGNLQFNGIYFQNGNHPGDSKTGYLPTSGDLHQNSEGYPKTFPSSGTSYILNQHAYDANESALTPKNTFDFAMMIPPSTHKPLDGYKLTKSLCRGFMISKYFLSKWFHTISIFLTLFLGIQRFISVAYPFKSQSMFSVTKTIVCCVVIFLLSHILHVFHLSDEKAIDGQCQWELKETGCKGGCIYLWMMFFIRHFIPCMALIIFTALFIRELNKGERNLRRINSTISQVSRRADENRRITFIVVAVVIVFLIPEVPYGVFLLYNAIAKTSNNGQAIDLETNRAIHMVYELLLVVSFHANFYIYTLFNRRFRKTLKRTFIYPIRRVFGDQRRFSISRTSSSSQRPVTRKTDFTLSSAHELKELNAIDRSSPCKMDEQILESFIPKSTNRDIGDNVETKFMESVSAEITQNQESSDHDALNTNV